MSRARELFDVPVLAGRLEDQQLGAASLDAVILIDVLEHLPNPRQTLARAVSLLRPPGGFLMIQTPCYPAGWSYEALCAEDHPFLTQLKPVEHLHLFSEAAVRRLCAELGVGQVRFERAIFAHYDLFAVASAAPLAERPPTEQAEMLLAASPHGRMALALLDLGETRDALRERIAAAAAEFRDLQGHFDRSEADRAARLAVIERQGAEAGRLHAEIDRHLREVAKLANELAEAVRQREQLATETANLRQQREHLTTQINEMRATHTALVSEFGAWREHDKMLNNHWMTRLLKKIGFRPG